ncbi:MAG: DUF6259 domain-containing protein [Kiritimatiellae bacterium]|nr:DUF6259 domain-containing protein [Kiritimatiellia bacterium]
MQERRTHRRVASMACVLLGFALQVGGVRAHADTTVRRFALAPVAADGVDVDGGQLRLSYTYAQTGNEPLLMEAERASLLRLDPDLGRLRPDSTASGGFAIAYAHTASFRFTLQTPGAYTVWYRALFPAQGTWLHFENMDGGESRTFTDSDGAIPNQWLWTQGPTYTLTAGQHSLNLTPHGWWGGARLDKIALLAAGTPAPVGTGTTSAAAPMGTVRTEPLQSKNLVRWGSLALTNLTGAGAVRAEYSTDRGTSWSPLPPRGDLSSLPPQASLAFRFHLSPDTNGMTPILDRPQVTAMARQTPDLILADSNMQLRFSGDTGALLGIRNLKTATDYMLPDTETPLFAFDAIHCDYGPVREIGFDQAALRHARIRRAKRHLDMTFALLNGQVLASLTVSLEPAGLARFSLRVANRSSNTLCRVRVPQLRNLRIGADAANDKLFTPILSGGIAPYPASLRLPRLAYTDRALFYPGMAYTCWMDLWDEQGGGLYVACEDRDYRTTEICFSASGTEDPSFKRAGQADPPAAAGDYKRLAAPGQTIDIGFAKDLAIPPHRTVRVPNVILGVHEGDWHWGADRYRAWAQSWMKKADVPDWLMDTDGRAVTHMTWLGTFAELAKERGRDAAHREKYGMTHPPYPMWYVMSQKEETDAGPMSLNRILGTDEMFKAGIQKQHELGHRMMFYTLPPAFTPGFHREAKRLGPMPAAMVPDDEVPPKGFYAEIALRNLDGSLAYPDEVRSYQPVCMGATRWQNYLHHMLVEKYVRQYGSDGLYLDGMGLCTYPCANLRHGHAGYGEWLQGFTRLMPRVIRETRQSRPGGIYVGEGMGDVEMQYLDSGLFYTDNAPEVYRYTLPWNVGSLLDSPVSYNHQGYPTTHSLLEFATVYGLKAWGFNEYRTAAEPQREQIVAFRQNISPFQSRARFMDEVGLRIADASIRGKLYTRDDDGTRGALAVFFNPHPDTGAPGELDDSAVGAPRAAWRFTLDGRIEPLPIERHDGRLRFAIPPSRLSAVLFLERCEPFLTMDHVEPVVPGERGRACLTVRNMEPNPIAGKTSLLLPRGWEQTPLSFTLAGGESASFDLPFVVARGARYDVYDLYGVTHEANGRTTRRCLPMGVCRPVQAELYYLRGDTLTVEMRNSSTQAIQGTCRLMPPTPVIVTPAERAFTLAPAGTGVLTFTLGNLAAVSTREFIKAVLTYGRDETVAYEVVQPPMLNGGFEQDAAGDGFPDYFNYRSIYPLTAPGLALDREIVAEGKRSLRIDPFGRADANTLNTTYVRLVPNRHYQASCRIRRSANHPAIGVSVFSMCSWEAVRNVNVRLGFQESGPTNTWEQFKAEFTTPNILVPHQLVLSNSSRGAATVWFDDIRIEEVTTQ